MKYRTLIVMALGVLIGTNVFAAAMTKEHLSQLAGKGNAIKIIKPNQLQWRHSSVLPEDEKIALLFGDPTKPGIFMMQVRLPKDYRGTPHTHPYNAYANVVSGLLYIGTGKHFDKSKLRAIPAGSSFLIPAKVPHFEWTNEVTKVQVVARGPFSSDYIDTSKHPSIK